MPHGWGRLLRTLVWVLQGRPPADSMAEAVTKLVDAVCCIIHDGSPLRAEDQSGFYTGYLFTVLKVSPLHWLPFLRQRSQVQLHHASPG